MSVSYQQQPTYPYWWSPYHYPPWGAEVPTSVLTQNVCGVSLTNSFGNSFGNSANFVPLLTLHHQNTFWICKLNKCITTCFGCRGKFTRAVDGSLPVAPLDMIL